MIYQIRIKGHLGQQWVDWFEDLSISLQDNCETLLMRPLADLAALHGLLKQVRVLGMSLTSVDCTEQGQADWPDAEQ